MQDQTTIRKIIMTTIKSCTLTILLISLSSCGSNGGTVNVTDDGNYQENYGPFDANGNYREDWANKSPKRRVVRKKVTKPTTKPTTTRTTRKPTTTRTTHKPTTRHTTHKPTTHKKATPKKRTPRKITPKTKPPIIYTVKKGDTLWSLSVKYKSSTDLIRKANKIKGNNIRIGQRLIIPRK